MPGVSVCQVASHASRVHAGCSRSSEVSEVLEKTHTKQATHETLSQNYGSLSCGTTLHHAAQTEHVESQVRADGATLIDHSRLPGAPGQFRSMSYNTVMSETYIHWDRCACTVLLLACMQRPHSIIAVQCLRYLPEPPANAHLPYFVAGKGQLHPTISRN